MFNRARTLLVAPILFLAAIGHAQPATPAQRAGVVVDPKDKLATLHFQTNIGSFKMMDGYGRVEISFTGTMLISQLEGPEPQVSGDLQLQYNDKGRRVYFGRGSIVFRGSWRGVQWFGRNMKGVWFGRGAMRLAGEFDKNLYTGEYWYDDPKQKKPWFAQGTFTIQLPEFIFKEAPPIQPVPRSEFDKNKKK